MRNGWAYFISIRKQYSCVKMYAAGMTTHEM